MSTGQKIMRFKDDEERRIYIREYNKQWYQRNRERRLQKRRQYSEELKRWLNIYKSKLRCILCGESHPACIQFHHRNREEKSFGIGGIVRKTYVSIKRLEEELSKCEVLCGNCHAIHHWRETHAFDDWREILPPIE